MTAAGSSLPDALHQLQDAAAYSVGLSGGDSDDERQQQDVKQNQTEGQDGSWLSGWFPSYRGGPGNHPNDPESQLNKPFYQDTVGKSDGPQNSQPPKNSKAGRQSVKHTHEASSEDKERNKVTTHQSVEQSKDGQDDVLARALSRTTQGHRDDEYDEQNRKADPLALDSQDGRDKHQNQYADGRLSKPNPVDEPLSSEQNDPDHREKHPEAYPAHPQHEEHPAHRGPMWASRPDDAQRAKVKEMKARRKQQYREQRKRAIKEDKGEEDQQRPPNDAELQMGSNSRKSSRFFSHTKQRQDSPQPSTKYTPAEEKERPFRGMFGDASTDAEADDQNEGEEGPEAQKSQQDQQGQAQDPRATTSPGADQDGTAAPSDDDKLHKISGMMLGADGNASGRAEQTSRSGDERPPQEDKWAVLKQRVQATGAVAKRREDKKRAQQKKRVLGGLDMTAELQSGILPVVLLKMALERDEAGQRRVPVLLNHLRLQVTDSVNPMNNTQTVFRIELSYAGDVMKWVIYRSMSDFVTLHAHYRAAALRGYVGRAVGESGTADGEVGLPRFPKNSLPYLRQLQSQGRMRGEDGRRMFARFQRDSIEDYIVALTKRVMFRPEANRLCKFFELSGLGVSLATRGGFSGKQGYLRVLSRGGRKNEQASILSPMRWVGAQKPKWFIVRESYIAICPGPETLEVHDIFLIDSEFRVERPKRIYKQATHLAAELKNRDDDDSSDEENGAREVHAEVQGQTTQSRRDGNAANTNVSSHTFYIHNSERKLKLSAKSDRILEQFVSSMERVALQSPFSGSNRFGSFAPIRLNVNAQWLIDGRDYFWEVSRALLMAKDRIMIHDWWLSPELYLRRPGEPKWRLDNILKKKAQEGVKVFVILYNEVSNNFTPTDSGYTKSRLTALHPNIYVQRSPSHFQTGTFYWAHHEKMCAIDETIGFMGGLDLCFGRYDTPAHVLVDDVDADYAQGGAKVTNGADGSQLLGPADKNGREAHVWPGQDYANERVAEWSDLTKPANDLFDRTRYPRMPWHDTGLQIVGQPARDLCRHFTQRWNFLLRNKNHSRKFPFLVPAPDFTPEELDKYQLTGTCEVQICRSAGPWSLGTNKTVEHSIQNAYLKCIQLSDHFVYIENQFFVTSTQVEGTMIENNIGNALVDRIIRAHREGTKWRAVIVIPLIPGFPMPISEPDASSVRIICDCQFRSICRGEHSIFGKLRNEGIDPDQYISFFSLRNWGKLKGGQLTTEQVYIHGKCAVFDDRVAIIGSANINERSQRGDRDSELACVIRDTDMIDSQMAGKPYKVGNFAHTMRLRLMREHLGVNVDDLEQKEAHLDLQEHQADMAVEKRKGANGEAKTSEGKSEQDNDVWDPDDEERKGVDEADEGNVTRVKSRKRTKELGRHATLALKDSSTGAKTKVQDIMADPRDAIAGDSGNPAEKASEAKLDDTGKDRADDETSADQKKRSKNLEKLLSHDGEALRDPEYSAGVGVKQQTQPEDSANRENEDLSTTVEERHLAERQRKISAASRSSYDDGDRHRRAVSEEPSGELRRQDARHRMDESASAPILDSHNQREQARKRINAQMSANPWSPPLSVPQVTLECFQDPVSDAFYEDVWLAAAIHNTQIYRKVFRCVPDDTVTTWGEYKAFMAWSERLSKSGKFASKEGTSARQEIPPEARGPGAHLQGGSARSSSDSERDDPGKSDGKQGTGSKGAMDRGNEGQHGKSASQGPAASYSNPAATNTTTNNHTSHNNDDTSPGAFSDRELEQMESLLDETVGNLVVFPTRFLETEDRTRNFLFPLDVIQPMAIFA
ncbi:unnamed protein product [Jaminaea pallidilutea]